MRFFSQILAFLPIFASATVAGQCVDNATATEIVANFIELTNGNAFNRTLAQALIAPSVVDTSGSVASVINSG